MAYASITFGTFLVVLTLADTFFTVLNYNQRGLVVNKVIGLEWRLIHWLVRPLSQHIRRPIYRTMTGLTLLSGIAIWVSGIVLGFAFIFSGEMELGLLKVDDHAPGGFVGAVYFSMAQFSTVGAIGLTPHSTVVSVLSVTESLLSVLLLSLIITYLANIFNSIEALRTYCACFPSRTKQVDSALTTLEPYLPREDASSLENHLATARESMNSYFDSIAADHTAIYFYSGKERFVMPFAVFMTAGTIEGLSSGLPPNHPSSRLPELIRVSEAFDSCREQIYTLFRWDAPRPAEPLDQDAFVAKATHAAKSKQAFYGVDIKGDHTPSLPVRMARNLDVPKQIAKARTERFETADHYVHRFVRLRQVVSRMSELDQPSNWADEYQAYVKWLGFVPLSDDFIRRTSELFDYQPRFAETENSGDVPLNIYGWRSETSA